MKNMIPTMSNKQTCQLKKKEREIEERKKSVILVSVCVYYFLLI